MDTELLLQIQKNEKIWSLFYNEKDELIEVITSNEKRTLYYLYNVENNKLIKDKKKAKCPLDLRLNEI